MLRRPHFLQRLAVIERDDLYEFADHILPVAQDLVCPGAACPVKMFLDEVFEYLYVFFLPDVFKLDHIEVAKRIEVACFIEDIRDASAHPRGEIAARFAEHNYCSARHIFAAVVADSLDYRRRAAVAHSESFASHPVDKYLAAGRAVKNRVSRDDIFVGRKRCACGRDEDDSASAEAFAEVIVTLAC